MVGRSGRCIALGLGDGRYETRLVADAVRVQTGQRFLADGLSSDYEQFKYLMDNAVTFDKALMGWWSGLLHFQRRSR